MNTPYEIDRNALLAAVRVQAALALIPHIAGPKHVWATWMRDNFEEELHRVPKPSAASPHPRILGSLHRMLLRYYRGGMRIEMLNFDEVRADDELTTDPKYVDVPPDMLPELEGADFWWQVLPPPAILKVASPLSSTISPPRDVAGEQSEDSDRASPPRLKLRVNSSHRVVDAPPSSVRDGAGGKDGGAGTTRTVGKGSASTVSKNKKRSAEEHNAPYRKKRKESESCNLVDKDVDTSHATTSSLKGKARALTPISSDESEAHESEAPEASKQICDGCVRRGSTCIWPPTKASGSPNEKQACAACVSHKTRCHIEGVFSIRRPRGKAGAAASQRNVEGLKDYIAELSLRITNLEHKRAAHKEEELKLMTKLARLELQLARLIKDMHNT